MEYKIPEDRMDDVMGILWQLMCTVEDCADDTGNPLDKLLVQGSYRLWNDITGDTKKPIWVHRKERQHG